MAPKFDRSKVTSGGASQISHGVSKHNKGASPLRIYNRATGATLSASSRECASATASSLLSALFSCALRPKVHVMNCCRICQHSRTSLTNRAPANTALA